METIVIEQLKQALREIIAPQIEGIRGDISGLRSEITGIRSEIKALESKMDVKFELMDAKFMALDMKIESVRREVLAEVRRVEDTLSADFVRVESIFDLRLSHLEKKN